MVFRMKEHLTKHIDENAQKMYEAASDKVMAKEKVMRSDISSKLAVASKEARQKLYDDIMLVLQDEVFDKANPKMRATRRSLQTRLLGAIENIESAWKSVLTDPINQLKAHNNFEIADAHIGDDDDDSGVDGHLESDDSESEGDDFMDSEDDEE